MKILCIDNNRDLVDMLTKTLKMMGHECIAAYDGKTGLELLENIKFDITLLDHAMPEFSGSDVVKSLNESGRIKEQNVVILSASIDKDEGEKLEGLGVKQILKKPIQLEALVRVLDSVANKAEKALV